MKCPKCERENPSGAVRCLSCNTTLDGNPIPPSGVVEDWSPPTEGLGSTSSFQSPSALEVGNILGGRYEILQLLGEGGMGAVYKARDRELNRLVALKVIRPDLANQPEVIQRFKQELILARQVTHKNVIRIFDLGEAGGIKFISMDYVEGQDLRSLLRQKGKLTPGEAIAVVTQVCQALDAAHAEGVVHRDLKPQNIMLDNQGRAIVMDFGIARSMELTRGLTQTGALVGTPEYMSPEQAKGQAADARSDVFTLGIIFYELLIGKTPYHADTLLGMLLRRTRERARPPVEFDPTLPRYVSDVVMKCLEIDPKLRYQKATQIAADLGAQRRPRTRLSLLLPRFRTVEEAPTKWIAPALVAILLTIIGVIFRGKLFGPVVTPRPASAAVSLAVFPFRNATGDADLNWLSRYLSETLSTDVGQSLSLNAVSQDRIRQALADLKLTAGDALDPQALRQVTDALNAQIAVSGRYVKLGERLSIEATLRDLKRGRAVSLKAEARDDNALPAAVDRLAQSIRDNLGLPPSVIKELQAQAFRPSSNSLAALRAYDEGLQLLRQGRNLDAQKRFQAAITGDRQFALAYSKLAQSYAVLGYDSQAELNSQKAVTMSESLPAPERSRILAAHARITNDKPKAIRAYLDLAKVAPDDPDIQLALGWLYETSGSFDKARECYGKVLSGDKKSIEALLGMGRVETRSGNAEGGLEYLNRARTLAIELDNQEEEATILQAIGVAYRHLNKEQEALVNYRQSLAIKRRLGDKRGIAASLNEIAQIVEVQGKTDEAAKSYQEALELRREIGDKKGVGDTLIDLGGLYHDRGHYDEAMKLLTESLEIQRELGNEANQSICLNTIGSCYFYKGRYQDAFTYFQQALQLREKAGAPDEIVMTVHNLADTDARLGQYDDALKYYLRALDLYRTIGDKRGQAIESSSMGTLFEYQGRYGAAVNSEQEALKTIRELGDRTFWMVEILGGYGDALAQAGRGEQAKGSLDEAMNLARQLRNQAQVAEVLNYQGDCFFYRGEYKSAERLYQQALHLASASKDRDETLRARLSVGRVLVKLGRSREAINALKALARETDLLGLKYWSVECSVYMAEAMVNSRDFSGARQALDQALAKSEMLGLRTLSAKAQYLLATTLRLTGNGEEAAGHYRETLRLLDEIRQEPGGQSVIDRADLHPIYSEATRWSPNGKA